MAKGDFRLRRSLEDRFYDKFVVNPENGCWIWHGGKTELGYGVIGLGHREQGTDKAHRVSYRLHKSEIPQGMAVMHLCDVPSCVNPAHLSLGTLSDNMRDCVKKKRNFVPDNRGEKAVWAKLSAIAVEHIRRKEMSGVAYAKHYGVSKSAIYQIWAGQNWANA
jgi:hypothetical protein